MRDGYSDPTPSFIFPSPQCIAVTSAPSLDKTVGVVVDVAPLERSATIFNPLRKLQGIILKCI